MYVYVYVCNIFIQSYFVAGGLFALGAATRQNHHTDKYMEVGKGITNTCHESYIRTPTQLGPEAFRLVLNSSNCSNPSLMPISG